MKIKYTCIFVDLAMSGKMNAMQNPESTNFRRDWNKIDEHDFNTGILSVKTRAEFINFFKPQKETRDLQSRSTCFGSFLLPRFSI
jgi:hypothetical protein